MNRLLLEFHPLSNKQWGSIRHSQTARTRQNAKWAKNVGTLKEVLVCIPPKCANVHRFSKIMATPLTTNCFFCQESPSSKSWMIAIQQVSNRQEQNWHHEKSPVAQPRTQKSPTFSGELGSVHISHWRRETTHGLKLHQTIGENNKLCQSKEKSKHLKKNKKKMKKKSGTARPTA